MTGITAVAGAELAWTIDGEGPELVLVHAGVADQRMWDALIPMLRVRHRVIRYDMRGFGRTRSAPGTFSAWRDLSGLLDRLSVTHAHVVGASFGGQVVLEFAATAPRRVDSLVLLAPALPDVDWSPEMESYGQAEEEALAAGRLAEAVELNLRMWVDGPGRRREDSDPRVRDAVAEMALNAFQIQRAAEHDARELDPPVSERLKDVRARTTVVVGDRDVGDFQRIAERLAAELPQATLRRVSGAGHLLALERPGEIAELITRHVALSDPDLTSR